MIGHSEKTHQKDPVAYLGFGWLNGESLKNQRFGINWILLESRGKLRCIKKERLSCPGKEVEITHSIAGKWVRYFVCKRKNLLQRIYSVRLCLA